MASIITETPALLAMTGLAPSFTLTQRCNLPINAARLRGPERADHPGLRTRLRTAMTSTPTLDEPRRHWFRRFMHHPIFPLVCLIPLTQIFRDEYPISHYPMYSQPTTRELRFQYVAGADGKPLPIIPYTGITPSQVGKKYSRHKAILIAKEEKRSGKSLDDLTGELEKTIKSAAGIETLVFLRDLSMKRKPEQRLTQPIKLVEVTLGFGKGEFTESEKVVAEIPASK